MPNEIVITNDNILYNNNYYTIDISNNSELKFKIDDLVSGLYSFSVLSTNSDSSNHALINVYINKSQTNVENKFIAHIIYTVGISDIKVYSNGKINYLRMEMNNLNLTSSHTFQYNIRKL